MTAERRPVAAVPPSHAALLDAPLNAVLTTHLPTGRLQSSVVWFWRDGACVCVSTMAEFRKARNMRARPRATLLVTESGRAGRWVELRSEAVPVPGDGTEDLDAVGLRYCGVTPYFGAVVPAELARTETPVTFRLVPRAVVVGPAAPRPPRRVTPGGPNRHPVAPAPADPLALPTSHLDLLDRPLTAAFSTVMPDGSAQTQPVWCGRDGDVVVVSTTLERRKGRNLVADPRATLLVIDPADGSRWMEIRADAELVTEGAVAVLDQLTADYTGLPHYYGGVAPADLADRETRVTVRLRPQRIVCDAIHR